MQTVEQKVDRLEKALEDFIFNVGIEYNKLINSQMRTEAEMRAFKDEMRVFKAEMKEFREESERDRKALHDEMKEFKDESERDRKALHDEMKEFKDEMSDFKKRQDEENRRKNKEWSNLAKKMGTIVEDLIAPALRPVLSSYFNCQVTMEGQRQFRRKDGEDYEIDAIAGCDNRVFMIEAKSTPRFSDIKDIAAKRDRFFDFFPEHEGKELIVIYGSITFPENIIKEASKNRMYVLGWREWEYMDILNFNEVI